MDNNGNFLLRWYKKSSRNLKLGIKEGILFWEMTQIFIKAVNDVSFQAGY